MGNHKKVIAQYLRKIANHFAAFEKEFPIEMNSSFETDEYMDQPLPNIEEDDCEIYELRDRIYKIFYKYNSVPFSEDLVNDLVALIEQHEVEEFPEHAAEEPEAHLSGKTQMEFNEKGSSCGSNCSCGPNCQCGSNCSCRG